jgi:hypothetical protein
VLVVPNAHWARPRPTAASRSRACAGPLPRPRLAPGLPAREFDVDVPASGDVTLDVGF